MAIAYGPIVSAGPYALPIIATVLSLVIYSVYTFRVGQARIKHSIPAPTMTGPEEFNRVIRIHANQLEQTVPFLASLWLFSLFVSPVIGFALALVWLERRWHYSDVYTAKGYGKHLAAYTVTAYMVINVYLLGAVVAALLSFVA